MTPRADLARPAQQQTSRSGVIGLAGAAASGALGFLLAVVITRSYGAEGSGALFVAIGLLSIAMVACCLGADTALVWAMPRRTGPDAAARLMPVAIGPALAAALVVAVAGVVVAPPLASTMVPELGGEGARLLRMTAFALPVATLALLFLAALRGLRPVGSYVAVNMVGVPAARPLLVGTVAVLGGGVVFGLAMWVVPMALAVIVCVALLARPLGHRRALAARPGPEDWRTFWRFALPRAGSAAIDASSVWVSVLLVAALASQAEAGVFGAVGRYVLAGLLVMHGLRVAVAPQLSRLLGDGRRDEAAAVHHQCTTWVIALSWPLYLFLVVFGPGFLIIFGSEFVAGATALAILSVAMLISTGLGNVQTLLLMSGRSGWHLVATVAGLGTNVTLAILLVPGWGVVGAAIAWGTGIAVENISAAVAARRALGRPIITARIVWTGGIALGLAGGPALVGLFTAGRGVAGLLVAGAILLAIVAAATSLPAVRSRLREIARSLRPATGGAGAERWGLHVTGAR